MKHRHKNLLDFVVSRETAPQWAVTEQNLVQIYLPRNRFAERLIRRFQKLPATFRVDLDEFGSFVWLALDGERTVLELGGLIGEHFGESAEPLYERLSLFLRILKNNNLIRLTYREKQ
jgi:hypothetical protein